MMTGRKEGRREGRREGGREGGRERQSGGKRQREGGKTGGSNDLQTQLDNLVSVTYMHNGDVWVGSCIRFQGRVCDEVGDKITHVELSHSSTLPHQLLHLWR